MGVWRTSWMRRLLVSSCWTKYSHFRLAFWISHAVTCPNGVSWVRLYPLNCYCSEPVNSRCGRHQKNVHPKVSGHILEHNLGLLYVETSVCLKAYLILVVGKDYQATRRSDWSWSIAYQLITTHPRASLWCTVPEFHHLFSVPDVIWIRFMNLTKLDRLQRNAFRITILEEPHHIRNLVKTVCFGTSTMGYLA